MAEGSWAGTYISATLKKQFPNLTKQFILSLGIIRSPPGLSATYLMIAQNAQVSAGKSAPALSQPHPGQDLHGAGHADAQGGQTGEAPGTLFSLPTHQGLSRLFSWLP